MTDLGLIIYYRCDLLEIHYRNACAAKLHMLVAVTFHFLHRVKVLANELLEYASACAVEDSHTRLTELDSIVDEIGNGLHRLITTHTTHINVGFEIELACSHFACGGIAHR